MRYRLLSLLSLLAVLAGCTSPEASTLSIFIVADGREYVYQYTEPITVEQFLEEPEVARQIGQLGTLDRVNPQPWTQIFDGIRITIVRVEEEEYCEPEEIPFEEQTRLVEGLDSDESQIAQIGQNGLKEVCYRVQIEDGVAGEPSFVNEVVIQPAQDQIVWVGPASELEPVPIAGTLAYINNDNAWIIRGSSTTRRPLTFSADLDSRIFSLSPDGRQLLIARINADTETFNNQLYLIGDTQQETPELLGLPPQDVLYADWVPGVNNTISYSTGEPRQAPPGWQALNDLWVMRINPETGDQINIDEVLERSNGGLYGWWGRQYEWSPDGTRLAWIHADAVGLVDMENGELNDPLLRYAVHNPRLGDWSWRTTVSWSPDGSLLTTTIHGPPFGNELPENSPIYNIVVASADGSFSADIVERAGIWSTPRYSPEMVDPDSQFPTGYIAYLRAREWESSINGEYDLIIADRDGSNARVIFPPEGQPGMRAQQFAQDFTWSPDGTQIALIYQGNLWIVDVATGVAYQITQDRGASKPVWTQ